MMKYYGNSLNDFMTDYKSYSLNNLRDSIQDCVLSEARPHEVYETIRNTIVETITYHDACLRDCKELLSLLSGTATRFKRDSSMLYNLEVKSDTDWEMKTTKSDNTSK